MRCLIVDDSASFRAVLRAIFAKAPEIEVVGEATDGDVAVTLTRELRPDVITMDLQMPHRDGLGAIHQIMSETPTPIIVICAGADANRSRGFEAIELGAIEALEKPEAKDPARFERQAEAIRLAVLAVAGLKLITRHAPAAPRGQGPLPRPLLCLGIAASTGGPQALHRILTSLPADFPVPILVVQHVADGFTVALARWLADHCAIEVRVATDGEVLRGGRALFAPDRRHLVVSNGLVRLNDGPPAKNFRPSGSVLLASLAYEFGRGAAGLVLTGMGDDGVSGLRLIRDRGGFTAAQGPASSVIYGMPRIANESGAAEESLELDEIVPTLLGLVGRSGTRRKVLLLVDADESTLKLEQQILSPTYAVHVARTWREASKRLLGLRPDAVVIGATEVPSALDGLAGIPSVVVAAQKDLPALRAKTGAWAAVVGLPLQRETFARTIRDVTAD